MITHGGDVYAARRAVNGADIIDFSANINPLGTPEKVKNAIIKSVSDFADYPDVRCEKFCAAAGAYHKVSADFICAGSGAADLIFRIVKASGIKSAAVCAPCFGEYRRALYENGCTVLTYKENCPEKIICGADAVFICNPNNPTGYITDGNFIENIVKKHSDVLFIIDECFLDMTPYEKSSSLISKAHLYPNICIIKSLTKMYALAGLRIGYCICSDAELCGKIRRTGQPWAVSTPAQAAGAAAFECAEERSVFLNLIGAEREYLYKELSSLGFRAEKPTANFVFFRAEGKLNLVENLLKKGILVRSCADYEGLDGSFYRVCVRTHDENVILVNALKEAIYG